LNALYIAGFWFIVHMRLGILNGYYLVSTTSTKLRDFYICTHTGNLHEHRKFPTSFLLYFFT